MNADDAIKFIQSELNKALLEWMDRPLPTEEEQAKFMVAQYDDFLREHGGSASFDSLRDGVVTVTCKLPPALAELLFKDGAQ